MVFFNDPIPCPDPDVMAVKMAIEMRECMNELSAEWRKRDYSLSFGVGIAQGYATLGKIGFEGRFDYAAIGTVANLASRLCDGAQPGQVLISQRVYGAGEDCVNVEPMGELNLKGLHRPVNVYNILTVKEDQ